MPRLRKSRFVVTVPCERAGEKYDAIYQTLTGAFVVLPEKDWRSLLKGSIESADPGRLEFFEEQGILVNEHMDEVTVFEGWKRAKAHDFTSLKSKVVVTRKCNNRCRYCIVDAEAKEMSRETAWAMDTFYIGLIREKNPKSIEDEYSGGEPFLNAGVILESATRRFFFCQGKGIDYGFRVINNGTLINPATVSALKKVGLRSVRVSIAGPADVHDRLRPSQGNRGTYALIAENLRAVSGMVPIGVECQYDGASMDYLRIPDMLDNLREQGIAVDDVAFTPILPQRGRKEFGASMGGVEILLHLMAEAEKRGFPQFAKPPSNACSADFMSRFAFDVDGSLIACPVMQSGEMTYGNVFKGVNFPLQAGMLNRAFADRCRDECEVLPICMGGCRLQALTKKGDFSGVDCYYETLILLLKEYIRRKAKEALAVGPGDN